MKKSKDISSADNGPYIGKAPDRRREKNERENASGAYAFHIEKQYCGI